MNKIEDYMKVVRQVKFHVQLLDMDERYFLNAHLRGKLLPKYSKEEARADMKFSMLTTELPEYRDTYASLIEKLDSWSEDVWEYIKALYPLPTDYEDGDLDFDNEFED